MGQPYHYETKWKKQGLLATVSRRAWLLHRGVGVTYGFCSGYPSVQVATSPASLPPDRPPCMCGTVRLSCPWFSPSQGVLWTCGLILPVVPSGLEPVHTRGECGQWLTQSGQSSARVARDPFERGLVTLSLWLRSVWIGSKPHCVRIYIGTGPI